MFLDCEHTGRAIHSLATVATTACEDPKNSPFCVLKQLLLREVPAMGLLQRKARPAGPASELTTGAAISKDSSPDSLSTAVALLDWWFGAKAGDRTMHAPSAPHAARTLRYGLAAEEEAKAATFIKEELEGLVLLAEAGRGVLLTMHWREHLAGDPRHRCPGAHGLHT